MIDRNHPAVKAAITSVRRAYGSRGAEPLAYHATALRAALPHLTADDLRHTPAGRALMAEGWRRGYRDRQNDYGAADVTPCPYEETPNE